MNRSRRASGFGVVASLAVLALAIACRREAPDPPAASTSSNPTRAGSASSAEYVGRTACARCHADQDRAWQGSHHDLAMQPASTDTVLGNFDDASFTTGSVTTRFFRRDGGFVVHTDGPDGQLRDFEVAYVFGVYPLQQYLIALPGGRYQALSIAWDSRPRAQGGQRWYHLYPDQRIAHDDVLHWTSFSQNWNAQCAACHSTNLRKGYDAATDTYRTTFSEMDVSCEACHGPGAAHVRWADQPDARGAANLTAEAMGLTASLRERRGVQWTMQVPRGIATRVPAPGGRRTEVEVCAPCHARRAERVDGHVPGQPWLDGYRPSLLSPSLYRVDGQMEDEVYTYGSFVQGRMHAAGVTCADCHDPHSLKVRGDGNAVCAQCHLPSTFDVTAHHGHRTGSAGASCVACHMPVETYMGVDRRHDHTFRVPRPDLTERLGVPNACASCHTRESTTWLSAALDRWRGPGWRARPQFADAFAGGRAGDAASGPALDAIARDAGQSAIVRASALELLPSAARTSFEGTLTTLAADAEPLVRLGVVQALQSLPADARARVGARLLVDPMRTVRLDAAMALAGEPAAWLTPADQATLSARLDEVRASETFNADRPEAGVNLALLDERLGRPAQAAERYAASIGRAPWFLPAYVNLAELQRLGGQEAEAERTLRRGLAVAPRDAGLLYALGLSLHRQRRGAEAAEVLADAAAAAPDVPRYALAHALALEVQGRPLDGLAAVDRALARHPDDLDLLTAGASIAAAAGQASKGRAYVTRLRVLAPHDPAIADLAQRLGAP